MGREIDIYDGPLTDDDRAYLEARNRYAEIEMNDQHYGTKAAEEARRAEEQEAARLEAEKAGKEFTPADASPEDDPDDVEAVMDLKYDQLQKFLKDNAKEGEKPNLNDKKPELQKLVLARLREIRAEEAKAESGDEELAED